jgi:hypothetical protein
MNTFLCFIFVLFFSFAFICFVVYVYTQVGYRSWLRHCAKRRKVAGSVFSGFLDSIVTAAVWHWGTFSL